MFNEQFPKEELLNLLKKPYSELRDLYGINELRNLFSETTEEEYIDWAISQPIPKIVSQEKATYDGTYFIKENNYWLVYQQDRGALRSGSFDEKTPIKFDSYLEARRYLARITKPGFIPRSTAPSMPSSEERVLMRYAGFWKRFGAYWIDVIVFLPIMVLSHWGNEQSRLFQLYWLVPGLIIGLWFHVYLVKTYGGTPGKLLLKIKIAKVDGSEVGYKEAMLRYSVLFAISLMMSAALIPVALEMTDTEYFSMGWQERSLYMVERASGWYNIAGIAMNIWIWSEFIVMLTNKKRRALHDFIAGTVVIHKESLNKSSQKDESQAGAAA